MGQTDVSTTHSADRRHRDRNTAAAPAQAIRGRGPASPRRGEGATPHGPRRGGTSSAGAPSTYALRTDTCRTQATASRRGQQIPREPAVLNQARRTERGRASCRTDGPAPLRAPSLGPWTFDQLDGSIRFPRQLGHVSIAQPHSGRQAMCVGEEGAWVAWRRAASKPAPYRIHRLTS